MTKEEIFKRVSSILEDYLRLDSGEVTLRSHVVEDLGADSLAMVELGFKFTEAFGIPMLNPDADALVIGGLVDRIHAEMQR
jgi:acyl carrier protein